MFSLSLSLARPGQVGNIIFHKRDFDDIAAHPMPIITQLCSRKSSKERIFQSRTNIRVMKASSPMTFQLVASLRSADEIHERREVKLINLVFSISEELPCLMIYVFIKGWEWERKRGKNNVALCMKLIGDTLHDDLSWVLWSDNSRN